MAHQQPATEADATPFAHGSAWVRADFHLHTKVDKEFDYHGPENDFAAAYVAALKKANIGLGVITNHNKFGLDEFKALRRRARKEGIGLLPGVELSVADGANGVHTLIVFSDDWLAEGSGFGRSQASEAHSNNMLLAREVGFDMRAYWQPSASYFGRVSKERIVQAVRKGVSEQTAQNIARIKKQAMAEAEAAALSGKGWLPALLRQAPTK